MITGAKRAVTSIHRFLSYQYKQCQRQSTMTRPAHVVWISTYPETSAKIQNERRLTQFEKAHQKVLLFVSVVFGKTVILWTLCRKVSAGHRMTMCPLSFSTKRESFDTSVVIMICRGGLVSLRLTQYTCNWWTTRFHFSFFFNTTMQLDQNDKTTTQQTRPITWSRQNPTHFDRNSIRNLGKLEQMFIHPKDAQEIKTKNCQKIAVFFQTDFARIKQTGVRVRGTGEKIHTATLVYTSWWRQDGFIHNCAFSCVHMTWIRNGQGGIHTGCVTFQCGVWCETSLLWEPKTHRTQCESGLCDGWRRKSSAWNTHLSLIQDLPHSNTCFWHSFDTPSWSSGALVCVKQLQTTTQTSFCTMRSFLQWEVSAEFPLLRSGSPWMSHVRVALRLTMSVHNALTPSSVKQASSSVWVWWRCVRACACVYTCVFDLLCTNSPFCACVLQFSGDSVDPVTSVCFFGFAIRQQ